jgi:uncharacterized membrane protein YiaA
VAGTGVWFVGAAAVITALLALFQASHSHSQGFYLAALVYTGFAAVFVIALIGRAYDKHGSGH